MSHTRLSALDASFLTVETPTAHMHVGWAAVFDPPDDGPRPTFEELRDHIATRMSRAPRYRQRLEEVPFGVNEPVWVDDDDFDVAHHVLAAHSSNLDEVVSAAMSTPLEHSRPMWECWVAPELDDGRVGVVGKAHHSMVDGLAAVELASLLLDPTPDPPPAEDRGWRRVPVRARVKLWAQGLADPVRQELGLGRTIARVLATPGHVADR